VDRVAVAVDMICSRAFAVHLNTGASLAKSGKRKQLFFLDLILYRNDNKEVKLYLK
jgi:hypothetical protein